ncbi:MAG: hypothetical protein V2J62_12980 [candidate division KSB1 bacterium]|nr:hypothetical protein [candidate division KSB1 bacterium]
MKIHKPVSFVIGVLLIALSIVFFVAFKNAKGIIPLSIACSLIYIALKPGRVATLIFGHTLVVVGCMLLTWGLYLLPHSEPVLLHIFFRPLFWGLFSIFGGICAIFHGFCRCVMTGK